jgi:D-alanyl-D-alanine carboxypeptidase
MSYPDGTTDITCYQYEPWHYRYFGRTVAALIHNSGLTVREWLWNQGYGVAPQTVVRLAPRRMRAA